MVCHTYTTCYILYTEPLYFWPGPNVGASAFLTFTFSFTSKRGVFYVMLLNYLWWEGICRFPSRFLYGVIFPFDSVMFSPRIVLHPISFSTSYSSSSPSVSGSVGERVFPVLGPKVAGSGPLALSALLWFCLHDELPTAGVSSRTSPLLV